MLLQVATLPCHLIRSPRHVRATVPLVVCVLPDVGVRWHWPLFFVVDYWDVVDREQAQIGVLITTRQPTGPMRKEAASAGFYDSPGWCTRHARLQILTIEELLDGETIDMPPVGQVSVTFKKAPKAKGEAPEQLPLQE